MGIVDGRSAAFPTIPEPENAMRVNAMDRFGTCRSPIVDLDVGSSNPITRPNIFNAL
jgi:hypothetical protein